MPQKRHTVDQIVAKLRKADVELGKGKKVPEVCMLRGIDSVEIHRCGTWNLGEKKRVFEFWARYNEISLVHGGGNDCCRDDGPEGFFLTIYPEIENVVCLWPSWRAFNLHRGASCGDLFIHGAP